MLKLGCAVSIDDMPQDTHHGVPPRTAEPPQDDAPIRGQVRLIDHRRVSHGLYRRRREGLSKDEEFLRDLEAYRLLVPDGAAFTHVTAARLLGWRLPQLPEQVPVFMAVRGDVFHSRRPGLVCSRLTHDSDRGAVKGLPVDAPEEILLRCARDLGTLDLVIMIDSALAVGHLDPARMEQFLTSSRPGVRALRKAYEVSDHRCDSSGESLLRVFHTVVDVPVDPHVVLLGDRDQVVGVADLVIRGTAYVQEYDGAPHRSGRQQTIDLRRERGWAGTAYQRRAYTLDDLLNHPTVLMHELDRLLGRRHDVRRVRRWRALVAESLYDEAGRDRVLNRWRRQWGGMDWAETA